MDVRKLITGFLVLAAAAGGSALLISSVGPAATGAVPISPATLTADANNQASPSIGSNAFIPEYPAVTDVAPTDIAATTSSPDDPNNLTDVLADAYMNGVISANPNGPQNDSTGNPALTTPDPNSIASVVAGNPALQNVQTPNWDAEADVQPLKIIAASSSDAVAGYANALGTLLNNNLVKTNLQVMMDNGNGDPANASYIGSQIQNTLAGALDIQTPSSLVALQRSLVKIMVYQKNLFSLVSQANTDPVKASLIFENEQTGYDLAVQDFQSELQKASVLNGFSFVDKENNSGPVAFLDDLFGIQKAHALFGVGDISFDPAVFAELVKDFIHNIILQILKNTLIALLQRHVLTYLQGSGMPRFVQQWGVTLVNAFQQSAINAINSQMACVYPAFAPQLRLLLTAPYKAAGNNICANSFQAALGGNTLQQFYNNFSNGGWIAYGASILPSGNYYGGLYFNAQVANYAGRTQQQATEAKSIAGNGFTSGRDLKCDDGSDPNAVTTNCISQQTGASYGPPPNGGSCPVGTYPDIHANYGYCADGSEPVATSPAAATGQVFNSGIDSNPKLITAANDIVGLLNALTTSLMDSLATAAINAANNFVNNPGGSPGGGGVVGAVSSTIQGGGTAPPPLALMCNPAYESVSSTLTATLGATGGKPDANGNPPIYTWNANGTVRTGDILNISFPLAGTYPVTLSDSTGDAPANCTVLVTP